jgi:hypothetical protein
VWNGVDIRHGAGFSVWNGVHTRETGRVHRMGWMCGMGERVEGVGMCVVRGCYSYSYMIGTEFQVVRNCF